MTYLTGSPIKATDYNSFATLPGGMNQIYSDIYQGTIPTTLGTFNSSDACTYGYGQTPALTSVTAGSPIRATQWANLFNTMRASGTHQGTTVSPPVPATNPVVGDKIVANNSPTAMSTAIESLYSNRFNIALGQSTLTTGTQFSSSTPWGASLVFTCKLNFGTWDNARYFFNSGSYFSVNASYTAANPSSPTPEENSWISALNNLSGTAVNYKDASNTSGYAIAGRGFYGLTNSWQQLYSRTSGSGGGYYYYYASNMCIIGAKYEAAGSSGVVDIAIEMLDNDSYISQKYGTTRCWIDTVRSTGAVTVSIPTVYNANFVSS